MGGFSMPQMPDRLQKLLQRPLPSDDPAITGQPNPLQAARPMGMPSPAMRPPAAAMGAAPGAAAPGAAMPGAPPSPVQATPPSDDPSVSGMGPDLKPPADATAYILPQLKKLQGLEEQYASLHAPTPQEYKPSIWRRLLSIPIATAAGLGNPQAGAVASDQIVNAPYNRATAQYHAQADPIEKQISLAKESFPLYTAAGEAAWRNFEGARDVARENRERFTARSTAQYKADYNEIRQLISDNKHEEAANRIDQAQKVLDEKSQKNKDDLDWKNRLLDLKQQIADQKASKEQRGTPNQFAGTENKKAQAITRAKRDYEKKTAMLDPGDAQGHAEAATSLQQDMQDAQDAYEAEIGSLGGTAEHMEVGQGGRWKKSGGASATDSGGKAQPATPGAQPATPAAPAKDENRKPVAALKGHKTGDVVTLKSGQKVKITQLYSDGSFDHQPAK